MAHINWDNLQSLKTMHNSIHHLLKKYHQEQSVTEEDLLKELEFIKSTCGELITDWNYHLGYEE